MDLSFTVVAFRVTMPANNSRSHKAGFKMTQPFLGRRRSRTVFRSVLTIFCLSAAFPLQAYEMQVGRYSLYTATPTIAQQDLLAATMDLRFPDRIQAIGEAVHYILQRSGYRLAAPETLGPDIQALFELPLPAVHRNMGPISIRDALRVLIGSAFYLVQDPVHRLISFALCGPERFTTSTLKINDVREEPHDEK